MSTVQEIEEAIALLPKDQFAQLKHWILTNDPDAFDRALEAGIKAGKFDELAKKALEEHERGESKPL